MNVTDVVSWIKQMRLRVCGLRAVEGEVSCSRCGSTELMWWSAYRCSPYGIVEEWVCSDCGKPLLLKEVRQTCTDSEPGR